MILKLLSLSTPSISLLHSDCRRYCGAVMPHDSTEHEILHVGNRVFEHDKERLEDLEHLAANHCQVTFIGTKASSTKINGSTFCETSTSLRQIPTSDNTKLTQGIPLPLELKMLIFSANTQSNETVYIGVLLRAYFEVKNSALRRCLKSKIELKGSPQLVSSLVAGTIHPGSFRKQYPEGRILLDSRILETSLYSTVVYTNCGSRESTVGLNVQSLLDIPNSFVASISKPIEDLIDRPFH